MSKAEKKRSLLVTGAGGFVGQGTLKKLAALQDKFHKVVAMDIRELPENQRYSEFVYLAEDIRSPNLVDICKKC